MVKQRLSLFAYSLFIFCTGQISSINSHPSVAFLNPVCVTPYQGPLGKGPFKTIPQWFECSKKQGLPASGIIVCPANLDCPLWRFTKDIPSGVSSPLIIHSGPHDDTWGRIIKGKDGHGFRSTNAWIKNGIIHGPLVTFDYLFDADDFDFGQGKNVTHLELMYKNIQMQNPEAPLIIAATCIGAKIALECVARNPNIAPAALILESPFLDVKKVIKNWSKNYTAWIPLLETDTKADLIQSALELYFTNFDSSIEKPSAAISHIDANIPIFIAHLQADTFCSDQEMHEIVQKLSKRGSDNLYLLVIKDPKLSHGRLTNKKEFTQAINAFFAHYGLPHDSALAQEGKSLLDKAYYNAQVKDNSEWKIVKSI